MIIHTTAEGITLAKKLENDSAAFYESKARDYPQLGETLQGFAKENQKNIKNTEFTYYSAITDAIEGCFALNLETDNYVLDTAKKADLIATVIQQAAQMEETIRKYYMDAGEQMKAQMTDISRNFTLTAKKHNARIEQLTSLASA
jgi:hypothetical protein